MFLKNNLIFYIIILKIKRRVALLEEEVTRVKERLHENVEKCKIIEAAGQENEEVKLYHIYIYIYIKHNF